VQRGALHTTSFMKRLFFTLLIVAALGYIGYVGWSEYGVEIQSRLSGKAATPPPEPPPAPEPVAPATTPDPGFVSKIPPSEKRTAPLGVYYTLERLSVEVATGVKAVNPGEAVNLLGRMPDGTMRVTRDGADFTVKPSQVTNDLDVAREAELKAFKSGQLK
jgi:hypothetical protein